MKLELLREQVWEVVRVAGMTCESCRHSCSSADMYRGEVLSCDKWECCFPLPLAPSFVCEAWEPKQ
jgi:hypothetical protein